MYEQAAAVVLRFLFLKREITLTSLEERFYQHSYCSSLHYFFIF